jgi:hypothetical protein
MTTGWGAQASWREDSPRTVCLVAAVAVEDRARVGALGESLDAGSMPRRCGRWARLGRTCRRLPAAERATLALGRHSLFPPAHARRSAGRLAF